VTPVDRDGTVPAVAVALAGPVRDHRGMDIKELGHLVLYVRDLPTSARFYRDVLGWRQILGGPQAPFPVAAFSAPSNRTHHELLLIEVGADAAALPAGRRLGLYHFGLKIGDSDDELREALARLTDAGVPVLGMSDHTVTHSLYIADPDGNEIELFIDVPGVDWRSDPALIGAPTKRLQL
jgi:catechol 2,3-dioxygenase